MKLKRGKPERKVKLDDYLIAIKNLKKHKEGLSKELMKVQLDKYARRELSSNEYTTFELLYSLWLDEDMRNEILFPNTNKTSSVNSLFS